MAILPYLKIEFRIAFCHGFTELDCCWHETGSWAKLHTAPLSRPMAWSHRGLRWQRRARPSNLKGPREVPSVKADVVGRGRDMLLLPLCYVAAAAWNRTNNVDRNLCYCGLCCRVLGLCWSGFLHSTHRTVCCTSRRWSRLSDFVTWIV